MQQLRARFNTIRIIAASLAGSIWIYALVLFLVAGQQEPQEPNQIMIAALLAVGAGVLGAGAIVSRGAYSPEFVRQTLGGETKWEDPAITPPGVTKLLGAYFTKIIVSSAMMEACAIFGFVLIFLFGEAAHAVGGLMMGGAFLAMLVNFPSLKRFVDACEAAGLYPPKG